MVVLSQKKAVRKGDQTIQKTRPCNCTWDSAGPTGSETDWHAPNPKGRLKNGSFDFFNMCLCSNFSTAKANAIRWYIKSEQPGSWGQQYGLNSDQCTQKTRSIQLLQVKPLESSPPQQHPAQQAVRPENRHETSSKQAQKSWARLVSLKYQRETSSKLAQS